MAAKKTAAKETTATKTAVAKAPAAKKSAPAKKAVAEKAAAMEAPVKKAPAKKALVKKTPAKRPEEAKPAVNSVATKTAAGKAPAKKAPAKKTAARKTAAPRAAAPEAVAEAAVVDSTAVAAPADTVTPVKKKTATGGKTATEKTGARTVAAKKTAGGVTTAETDVAVPPARAGELAVRPGEDPWSPEEVAEARRELQAEVLRLRSELAHSQEELTGLMRDSGDGAGDDQADTGTKNITREHELALAANAREMLEQTEHALERLDAGTYGLCEICGKPIGKARMQAFPRATLCVEDKQKQERRG